MESVRVEIRNFYRVEQRANCVYCNGPVSLQSATGAPVEHIASKAKYPNYIFEPLNLCVACADCNEIKNDREVLDPVVISPAPKRYSKKTQHYRIVHPHYDTYEDHIEHVGVFYWGKTKKGSYTIYICGLDRYVRYFHMSQEILDQLDLISDRHRFHGG
ncbi:hypothetical protein bcgnr5380_56450 [Bacillus cereus]